MGLSRLILYLTALLLLLAGCQTAYGPMGLHGGYSDKHIEGNIYHVRFDGNFQTPLRMVREFVDRRSEEVCRENGYSGYGIVTTNHESESRQFYGLGPSYHTAYVVEATIKCRQ